MTTLYIVAGVVVLVLGMFLISSYISRKRGEASQRARERAREVLEHEEFERRGEEWDQADPMSRAARVARGMPDNRDG